MPNKVNQYVDIPISQDSFAPPSAKSHLSQYKEQVQQVPPLPSFCDQVIETIPNSLFGRDRMVHIAQVLEKISKSQIVELQAIIEYFMRFMLEKGASDLDMGGPACNNCIWLRIDGHKRKHIELGYYTPDQTNVLLLSLLTESQRTDLLGTYALDISRQIKAGKDGGVWHRYRTSMYFDNEHLAFNIRAIANELRPIDSLGFHPTIKQGLMFDHVRDGLTLITGVTGSGKSTTLDTIVDENNSRVDGHIVIIAKPIEFIHLSKRSIVRHREVGKDVASFHQGVVQALRQDPDIIVIGEMRDPQTISAALEVTDSGHKVFSTLHTSSAVESVARIVAEYDKAEQERVRNRLADVLRCIISQKLLPKIGGGRVLAKEVLWVTPSVRAAIKGNNLDEIYQMMWEGRAQGQHTLEQDLFRLMKQRMIDRNVGMDYANNKKRLAQLLGMM
ncbi:MAG: type IV pilus twitching motility protein PilT [Rhodothermaceae bacterium]|nr:type IV pilus twitching motility protein PilT [Rhodothermaceae bacterium]